MARLDGTIGNVMKPAGYPQVPGGPKLFPHDAFIAQITRRYQTARQTDKCSLSRPAGEVTGDTERLTVRLFKYHRDQSTSADYSSNR